MSSASEFSNINLFLSENKIAFTPVSSLTLFISEAKFVKSLGNIVAEIETPSFKPEDKVIDIVPLIAISSIGSIITLVTASANIPDLDAFSLNSFNVYEEEELTGKIGNDMFLVGLPTVEKNLLKDSNLDVKLDQLEAVVSLKNNIDLNFDGSKWKDNNNNLYTGNSFNVNGLAVTLNGEAKKGDSFSLIANNDLSSSLKFNLKSGNEFAASAFKLAESNTNNLGTGELTIEGSYKDPLLDITSVEDIFADTDNTLLATSFLKNGAVASIGKNIKEINLKSYSLQPQLSYVITDDEVKF